MHLCLFEVHQLGKLCHLTSQFSFQALGWFAVYGVKLLPDNTAGQYRPSNNSIMASAVPRLPAFVNLTELASAQLQQTAEALRNQASTAFCYSMTESVSQVTRHVNLDGFVLILLLEAEMLQFRVPSETAVAGPGCTWRFRTTVRNSMPIRSGSGIACAQTTASQAVVIGFL